LVLRAVLYRQIGQDADCSPKLVLFFIVLAFPNRINGPVPICSFSGP
jgi:hypothetical protein